MSNIYHFQFNRLLLAFLQAITHVHLPKSLKYNSSLVKRMSDHHGKCGQLKSEGSVTWLFLRNYINMRNYLNY